MIRLLSLAALLAILSSANAQTVTIGGSVSIGQPQRVVRYNHYDYATPVRQRYVVETRPVRRYYDDYRYNYRYDYRYDTRYDTHRTDGVIRDAGRDYAYDRVRTSYYSDPYYERVYYDRYDNRYNNVYHAPRRDGAVIRIQIRP